MVTTAIPERVYALCKIVEKGPISLSELKDKMEPEFLGNGSVYFNDYKNAAQELELISVSDDQIQLAVDPKVALAILYNVSPMELLVEEDRVSSSSCLWGNLFVA